jgi:hypothetical protein
VVTPSNDPARGHLLVLAAGVLCRRHALGQYGELTAAQVDALASLLLGRAGDARAPDAEAVALAHRLIDDDAPDTSPLWPRDEAPHDPTGDDCRPGPVLAGGRR